MNSRQQLLGNRTSLLTAAGVAVSPSEDIKTRRLLLMNVVISTLNEQLY
jgi:hypothetical protein